MLALNLQVHWDKPEDAMKPVMTAALIAGGLMLMHSPEAAAHKEVRNTYHAPAHSYVDHRRIDHMPRWLRKDRDFRRWYRHSPLKRDRRLAWFQLYDIYRWERRWGRNYYRGDNYWLDYYAYRYGKSHHDRDRRHRRHRH